MGFTAFRSLSRALLRGFVRDRTALVFSLLLPVLFLAIATTPYFGLKLTAAWWMAIPVLICGTPAFMSIGGDPDRGPRFPLGRGLTVHRSFCGAVPW